MSAKATAHSPDKRTGRGSKGIVMKLPRERLAELLQRARISGTQMAKNLGYSSAPGFLRYMQEKSQGDRPIPYEIVQKLTPWLLNAGDPPITIDDILACTDTKMIAKPIVKAFDAIVNDGDGLVTVRYKIEPGVYVRLSQVRMLGASRIGAAKDYSAASQFVAVLAVDVDSVGPTGTQLHCVTINQTDVGDDHSGRRIVFAALESGELYEIDVGVVTVTSRGPVVQSLTTGRVREGVALGLVVGSYRRE